MENYIVSKNNNIVLLDSNIQEILRTQTNYKDLVVEINNKSKKNFTLYPYYINENLNVKMEFNVTSSTNSLTITFQSRTEIKVYYKNLKVDLKDINSIRIYQEKDTIALYLNNEFITIIKEKIISYSSFAIKGYEGLYFNLKNVNLIIPSKELGWKYNQSANHSYLLLKSNGKYLVESIKNVQSVVDEYLKKEVKVISPEDILVDFNYSTLSYSLTELNAKKYVVSLQHLDYNVSVNSVILTKVKNNEVAPVNKSLDIIITNKWNDLKEIPFIQIEEGSLSTAYIENNDIVKSVDESIFKVPIKNNINREAGTLVYKYVPNVEDTVFDIFNIGEFKLEYAKDKYILSSKTNTIPNKQINIMDKLKKTDTYLIWTWMKNIHTLTIIYDNTIKKLVNDTKQMDGSFDTMNFSPLVHHNGNIKQIDIYELDTIFGYETIESYINFMKINTQNKIFGIDLKEEISFFKKPFLESSLAPLDGSPILVRDEEGPLSRQFFFDEHTGKYRDYNEEYIEYMGGNQLKLAYKNLDVSFKPIITIMDGPFKGEIITNNSNIKDNVIHLDFGVEESTQLIATTLKVEYRILRSYNIEFNENAANDSYIINLDNPNGKNIIVTQEGDRFNNRKLATEIELNPILNPRHEGFMYITKNSQTTNSFRIQISSNMIVANGMDSCDILIEAIDEYKNEVLSPYLSVYIIDDEGKETAQYGNVYPLINYETMKARNTSGRLYYKYNAPYISSKEMNKEKKIFIIVYDRKNNIGTQGYIILKPSFDINKTIKNTIPKYSQIPFEYFSRYYERNNIPQEILNVLDFDKNGQLTRHDLERLEEKQYLEVEMGTITKNIEDWERFE